MAAQGRVFCTLCALRAFVYKEGSGRVAYDWTLDEHMARVHPDPVAAAMERDVLEIAMMRMLGIVREPRDDDGR